MKSVLFFSLLLAGTVSYEGYAQQTQAPQTEQRGGGQQGRFRDMTPVEASALPATVTNYVKEKYPKAEIRRAMQDTEQNYHVMIAADTTRRRLVFDAKGTFKEEMAMRPMGQGRGQRGNQK
ncbi:hypothetical protein GCM10023189_13010 [Nibrella saemangeumensis]|uniref:Beta-lactamase-inhibitor-like, PepSY-like n=1 Tax=Nibrella saemangeumensis TaxID=1084526 RepID=A0ABP8MM58_9BACT